MGACQLPMHRRNTLPVKLVEAIESCFAALDCEMFMALSVPGQPRHLIYRGPSESALQDGDEMYFATSAMESVLIRRLGRHRYQPSYISQAAMGYVQGLDTVVRELVAAGQVLSCRCTVIPTATTQEVYCSNNGVRLTMTPLVDPYGDEKDRFLADRFSAVRQP